MMRRPALQSDSPHARAALLIFLMSGAALYACAAPDDRTAGDGSGESSSNSSSSGAALDAGSDSGLSPDGACATVSVEATLSKRPIDVVMIVDNSGSMFDDIAAVQANINASLAGILGAAKVDYRVILISLQQWSDTAEYICVEQPLSTVSCDLIPPAPGINPPVFFPYSIEITSKDSWCKLLDTYNAALKDDFNFAPSGWSAWLRDSAFKVFVELSDDGVACGPYDDKDTALGGDAAAAAFDAELRALSPLSFGDAIQRNYVWHSIIGVSANAPASAPWLPADPVVLNLCNTGEKPGTGYQSLSVLTGGLRFPLCEHASYDAVFQAIAGDALASSGIECAFPIPPPPSGQTIDLDVVSVEYTPGGGGQAQTFQRVKDFASCKPASFYIDGQTIRLCPETCGDVRKDSAAKMNILFSCLSTPL